MPWRFVEMYGRIPFGDIVVFLALEENNRALRGLSRGESRPSLTQLQSLATSAERLAAAWELMRQSVPLAVVEAAEQRLSDVEDMLRPSLAVERARSTLHRLVLRAGSTKAKDELLALDGAQARERVVPVAPITPLSIAFQAESSAWQQLPMDGTDDERVLDGFVHCYARGRAIAGELARGEGDETFATWARWVRFSFHQLDFLRPALSADNRARRWCLGRLLDTFCKHDGLLGLRRWISDVAFDAEQQLRIEAVLESCLDATRERALKLVPHAFGATAETYRAAVREDLGRFALQHNQPLPRSA